MDSKILFLLFVVLFSAPVFAAVPEITSDTHPEGLWSNAPFIKVYISYDDADKFAYMVDSEEGTEVDLGSDSTTTIDATNSAISLGSKLDGIYWLHVRAKANSQWSDTAHYEIKIDENGPYRAENLTAIPDGTVVNITWDSATDDLAGIAYYDLYRSALRFVRDGEISREFRVRDAVAKKIGSELTGNSFVDEDITEGYRYHYKIQAVDNAGNLGRESTVASVIANSFCDFDITLSLGRSGNRVSVALDSTGKFKKGTLTVVSPSGDETILIDNNYNVASLDAEYSLDGRENGDYNFSFVCIDDDQDWCYAEKIFIYDSNPPEVGILGPDSAQVLEGSVEFRLSAKEPGENPSGIASVSLYAVKDGEEHLLGNASEEGGNYTFDWNTLTFDNGRFKIIARATDNAGNSTDDSSVYSVENIGFARTLASDAVRSAKAKRDEAVEYISGLEAQGIDTSALMGRLADADSNISYSQSLLDEGHHYEISKEKAEFAGSLYDSVGRLITVSQYGAQAYVYDLGELDFFLAASGLDSTIISDSKALISEFAPARRLIVNKISSGNGDEYRVSVALSFTNTRDSNVSFRVLEVIPKKFADSASSLFSAEGFEIIQDDPIIAFTMENVAPNAQGKAVYSISQALTKEQADAFIASNALNYYISPPMLVPQDTDLSAVRLASLLNFSSLVSSLPPVEWNTTTILILGAAILVVFFIILVILVIVVFAIYYFFIRKREPDGFQKFP